MGVGTKMCTRNHKDLLQAMRYFSGLHIIVNIFKDLGQVSLSIAKLKIYHMTSQ
jgi:hypothetical protein